MKIKSLYIEKYKNLSGTYNFEKSNAYVALIGLNGSGKSNLLEVISIIFKIIVGSCPPNSIGNFSLIYEIEGSVYYAEYRDSIGKLFINNTQRQPSSIISCYSGEDERLWKYGYEDDYVRFFNAAIAGGDYKPTSLYINKYCWKIAFISLLFSENEEVKLFITDKLKVNHNTITIQFKTKKNANPQPHDASNWYKRVETKYSGAEISIDDLINNEDIELLCTKYPNLTNDQIIFYYLYFLYIPDKLKTKGLEADKIIESIDITLNGYNFVDLSEGEKKLILIECITKVLGDENSLILLDEPDAHTHIAMKKDLLKLISEFEGQTIMTTHSPMFLNKHWDGFNENNIFYMHDGKIESSEPLKHLSELTDNEVDFFDSSYILGAKNLLVVEGPNDKRYLEKAISIFSKKDEKYKKLSQVAILPGNSAGNAKALYELVLKNKMQKIDHLIYLFDFDEGGYDGWKSIKTIVDNKVKYLFYQLDYNEVLNTSNKPVGADTIMVEDFFSERAYEHIVSKEKLDSKHSHKDFRNFKTNIASSIKTYLENNYSKDSFEEEWYDSFSSVLNKLLDEFELY